MKELSNHIQALPQELRDMIWDRVVAIEPGQKVYINKSTKTPWQLQVDPSDRDNLAPIYFGTSTFVMTYYWWPPAMATKIIVDWAREQTKAHLEMIKHINIEVKFGKLSKPLDLIEFENNLRARQWYVVAVKAMLSRNNIEFPNAEFTVTFGGRHDLEWVDSTGATSA